MEKMAYKVVMAKRKLRHYFQSHNVVTPDFPKKTKCTSYVRQDQVYTHMIDVMSEISINNNKNVQELNHYIISYYTQTIDSKVFTTIKR
jgi:hypothetical protein